MKIYIAGPMRGKPRHNFPAFDAARDWLERKGHCVYSPADADRSIGFDETKTAAENGFDLAAAMARNFEAIAECDAIYMLEGWQWSSGACAEIVYATGLGKRLLFESRRRTDWNGEQ